MTTPVGIVLDDVVLPPADTTPPEITATVTNSTSRYQIFTTVTNVSKSLRTVSVRVELSSTEVSGPVAIELELKDAAGVLATTSGGLAKGTGATYILVMTTTLFKRITSPYRKVTATVVATDTAGNKTTKSIAMNLRAV